MEKVDCQNSLLGGGEEFDFTEQWKNQCGYMDQTYEPRNVILKK